MVDAARDGRADRIAAMSSRRAALLAVLCAAASGAAAVPPAAPAVESAEPNVRRTVVEDRDVRVEELRVRGQVRHIVVHVKGERGSTYQIVPADGARDLSAGPASGRGAAGQRVWSVLSF